VHHVRSFVLPALIAAPIGATAAAQQAYPVEHPAFSVDLQAEAIGKVEAEVAPALKLSEAETRELLRPMTGFLEVRCANCAGGHQGYQLTWSIDDPHHTKCRYCGHVYPSDQYPMNKVKEIVSPQGERQEYPYYEGPDGYPHYFEAKIDYETQHYFAGAASRLAQLYAATGERQSARRAAVILQRLAEIYPSFSVHGIGDYSFRAPTFHPFEQPYPYLSGRWGAVWLYHEISHDCLYAYDRLCPSGEFEALSAELGRDVRKQIEDDLLRGMVEFTLAHPRHLNNMTPSLSRGLILAGKVLGVPDYLHIGVSMMQDLLAQEFLADGMWHEGAVSYHQQTIRGLHGALASAEGHTDPPGYVFEEDGTRFDDLQVLKEMPFVEKCLQAVDELAYPDNSHLCVHDTWAGDGAVRFRPDSRSKLLYSMGQAMLRSGEGREQTVVGLHFSGSHGHAHADLLDLTLFAEGRELVPDLGYTHTPYRPFLCSTAAHNTVVVDESNGSAGAGSIPWGGRLEIWEPGGEPAQVVSVNCPGAYSQTNVYQRTCALVDMPGGGQYAFDMFRVEGGSRHDYLLKGSRRVGQAIESSIELTERDHTLLGPGLTYKPYPNEGGSPTVDGKYNVYGLLQDVASAQTGEAWRVTFRGEEGPGLRATVMTDGNAEVCAATYPTVYQTQEDSAKLEDYRGKMLAVRRAGDDLQSTFVAALEPFGQEGPALEVSPVEVGGRLVGARIRGQGFTDVIVFLQDRPAEMLAIDQQLSTRARFALVRTADGQTTVQVIDGAATAGELAVDTGPPVVGEVAAVDREARRLAVAAEAEPAGLEGRHVIVDHADGATSVFQIEAAEKDGNGIALVLSEAPDFVLTGQGTKFLFYPVREIVGRATARVLRTAKTNH